MSTNTPANAPQAPEPTPEQRQALAEAEAAIATLERRLRELRAATAYDMEASTAPRTHAAEMLADVQEMQYKVKGLPDSAEKAYASKALVIQQRLWEGTGKMIEAQLACDARNLAILDKALEMIEACQGNPNAWVHLHEQGLLGDALPLAVHEADVPYQLGRAQMHLFLGLHLWLANLDGIDAILRATANGEAIEPADEAEAAARQAIADAFKAAMAADPAIAQLLPGLGADLAEAFTYLEWAAPLLKAILAMPAEAQAKRLADPDWGRLAAQVQVLTSLIPKMQAFPDLAPFFHPARSPELPFALPAPPAAALAR